MSSNQKNSGTGVRVVPGKPMPSPEYRYQSHQGGSGHVSAQRPSVPERQFVELQSFNLG